MTIIYFYIQILSCFSKLEIQSIKEINMLHKKHPGAHVPSDIKIKKGRVIFGLKDNPSRGIEAVILPTFDIRNYSLTGIAQVVERINAMTKKFQDSYCEELVKQNYNGLDSRFTLENGNLVALDEDAATQLFQLRFPLSNFRFCVPI